MDHYKFNTVEPVGRLRTAKRLDDQSIPHQDIDVREEIITLSETANTKEILEEIGKRLSHIEISDETQCGNNKVCLVFENGEEYEIGLSKVDNEKKD